MTRLLPVAMLLLAVGAFTTFTSAQDSIPSPPATAEVMLAGKRITIRYSRPSRRGRKIMGALVPYEQVWRTGANEATTLETPIPLKIGNADVPAGEYTLWTLPSAASWKLIINKQTGQWGTEYDPNQDLVRVEMQKDALSAPVEQFSISWKKQTATKADLVLEWENTKASVVVEAKVVQAK
jgi:hypothetical protein